MSSARSVQTDDRGEYRVWGLAPGRYYLRAQPPPRSGQVETLPPTYYPSELQADRAAVIDIHAAQEFAADIHTSSANLVRVSGTAAANDPAAVNIQFYLIPRDSKIRDRSGAIRGARGSAGGSFDLPAPGPGSYDLVATAAVADERAAGRGRRTFADRQTVDVHNEDIGGLALNLRPTVSLRVRLTGDVDAGLANRMDAFLRFRTSDDLPPGLQPTSTRSAGLASPAAPQMGPRELVFSNFLEGEYRIDTSVPVLLLDAYVADIRQGAASILDRGLVSIGKESAEPVEVILKRPAASIQGVIRDTKGMPARFAVVVLAPNGVRRDNPALFRTMVTLPDGSFLLRGLAPGEYKLFAFENVPAGAWLAPGYLDSFEQLGRGIGITAGNTISGVSAPLIRIP